MVKPTTTTTTATEVVDQARAAPRAAAVTAPAPVAPAAPAPVRVGVVVQPVYDGDAAAAADAAASGGHPAVHHGWGWWLLVVRVTAAAAATTTTPCSGRMKAAAAAAAHGGHRHVHAAHWGLVGVVQVRRWVHHGRRRMGHTAAAAAGHGRRGPGGAPVVATAAAPAAPAAPVGPPVVAADAHAVVHVVDVEVVGEVVRVADQHVLLLGGVGPVRVLDLDDVLAQVGVPARVAAREPDQGLEVLLAGHVDVDRLDGARGAAGGGGGGGGGPAGDCGSRHDGLLVSGKETKKKGRFRGVARKKELGTVVVVYSGSPMGLSFFFLPRRIGRKCRHGMH